MIRAFIAMIYGIWVMYSGAELAGGLLFTGGACWGMYWTLSKLKAEKAEYDRWEYTN